MSKISPAERNRAVQIADANLAIAQLPTYTAVIQKLAELMSVTPGTPQWCKAEIQLNVMLEKASDCIQG